MNSALKDGAILRCDRSFRSDSTVLVGTPQQSISTTRLTFSPISRSFSAICTEIQCKEKFAERSGKGLHIWLGRQNRCSIRFMDLWLKPGDDMACRPSRRNGSAL